MPQVTRVFGDSAMLYRTGAARVAELINQAIAAHGACFLALAGGSTPEGLYRELAGPRFAGLDWHRLHIYFGDERCVPPDHPDSNYRMAREALLDQVPIPPTQIHRIACEGTPESAAADYARLLHDTIPRQNGQPCFDLVLLGLGVDGHVASLFPGTDILTRTDTPAATVYVETLKAWRVSLTLPVLNQAHRILLLVAGTKKSDIVYRALHGLPEAQPLPVQRLCPPALEWLLDAEAAVRLGLETET